MGIGMVLIVGPQEAPKAMKELKKHGGQPMLIGEVVKGPKGVEFV
jgi:phosphoribosylaminoimidazole (AIR) synthetase